MHLSFKLTVVSAEKLIWTYDANKWEMTPNRRLTDAKSALTLANCRAYIKERLEMRQRLDTTTLPKPAP